MNKNEKFLFCFFLSIGFISNTFCLWRKNEFCDVIQKCISANNITQFYSYLDKKDVNEPSVEGCYFLHLIADFDCIRCRNKEEAEKLLVRMTKNVLFQSARRVPFSEPRVSPKDRLGNIPLYYAISREHLDVTKELLAQTIDLDTHLVEFARREHPDVFRRHFRNFSYR